MDEQKKKKRVRLPLRAYLLYLLVVTFALTGVTFSVMWSPPTGATGPVWRPSGS